MAAWYRARRYFLILGIGPVLSASPLLGAKLPKDSKGISVARLPIIFEPNQGQVSLPVKFQARAGNVYVGLRPGGIDLAFGGFGSKRAALALDFVHADQNAPITASEQKEGVTNYLLGPDSSRWYSHIPNFGRVTYSDLYPGISLAFYGNGQHLEYDFVVAPGADYHQVRMRVNGANSISIAADGSLKIVCSGGDLGFKRPDVYQASGNGKKNRSGRFVLLSKNEVGFIISAYDPSRPLIIDPILTYSTYLANLNLHMGAVATDASGDTFVTGMAFSNSYPSTAGAYQQTCKSCGSDQPEPYVFVTKVNPDGSGLIYSTYLGGSDYDQPNGIGVDGAGNAVIVGRTQSADFPLKNAIPVGYRGYGNELGFVTSLSADGSSLIYSSVLGGASMAPSASMTTAIAVAVDTNGNAYVTGFTDSPIFPVTPGAIDALTPAYPEQVVYISKFLPTGTLGYSSLLGDAELTAGGSGAIGPTGIGINSLGAAYIAGESGSLWPTTINAYQTHILASSQGTFVAKVSSDGSTLVYSTFLDNGTNGGEPTGIAVNANGEAFITGWGAPRNFPTTSNAYQPTLLSGFGASFLCELSADGSQLVYSSFFGGRAGQFIESNAIAIDAFGNVWIAGTTKDWEIPLIHPLQSVGPGLFSSSSAFVARFDPSGASLTFSTFFGDLLDESTELAGIAADPTGKIHMAGVTGDELYTSPRAYLPTVTPPPANNFYAYGFAAVIDPNVAAPALCASALGVDIFGIGFHVTNIGSSDTYSLTLQNCGTLPLNISSIEMSDPSLSIPAASNGCLQSIVPNTSCTLSLIWRPLIPGGLQGTMVIASNTPMPTVLPLYGVATGSPLTDFAFSTNPTSEPTILIPGPGNTSTPVTLLITGGNGYAGTVNFTSASCSVAPAGSGSSCVFSPGSVTGSGGTTVTIQTVRSASGNLLKFWSIENVSAKALNGGLVAACCLLLVMVVAKRLRKTMVYSTLALVILVLSHGCGGSPLSSDSPGGSVSATPTNVVYTVTVTAQSGQLTHTTSFTFMVQ